MALVKCRECGKKISSEATSCPSCGASKPAIPKKGMSGITKAVLVILAFSVFSAVLLPKNQKEPETPVVIAEENSEPAEIQKIEPVAQAECSRYSNIKSVDIVAEKGEPVSIEKLESNPNELVAKWEYADCIFTMAHAEFNGETAYRVTQIQEVGIGSPAEEKIKASIIEAKRSKDSPAYIKEQVGYGEKARKALWCVERTMKCDGDQIKTYLIGLPIGWVEKALGEPSNKQNIGSSEINYWSIKLDEYGGTKNYKLQIEFQGIMAKQVNLYG